MGMLEELFGLGSETADSDAGGEYTVVNIDDEEDTVGNEEADDNDDDEEHTGAQPNAALPATIGTKQGQDEDQHQCTCSKRTVGKFFCRTFLTAACVTAAVALPFFARVVGFIGAFTCCFVSVVVPTTAALTLLRRQMTWMEYTLSTLLALVGIICCVWGTIAVFTSQYPISLGHQDT